MPNFDEISQSTAEIKLLPISKNGRPPYWNSIFGFVFDLCIVIGMQFCIGLPNCVVIGRSSAELWRHNPFFQDYGRQPLLYLIWVMLDHSRSEKLLFSSWFSNLVLIRFIVLEILRFLYFAVLAWYCLFTPIFGGIFPPTIYSPIDLTPKRTILARKHVVWTIKRFDLTQHREKKARTGHDSQKSH